MSEPIDYAELGRLTLLAKRLRGYCTYNYTSELLSKDYGEFCERYGYKQRNGLARKPETQVLDCIEKLSQVLIAKHFPNENE